MKYVITVQISNVVYIGIQEFYYKQSDYPSDPLTSILEIAEKFNLADIERIKAIISKLQILINDWIAEAYPTIPTFTAIYLKRFETP